MSESSPATVENIDQHKKKDILKPPHQDLKVSYVIPIRGEVKNGNIFHQLKDFTVQDCSVNDFEALYIVNNTEEDRITENDSFRENQQLLSIFGFIAGKIDAPPDGLEEWQRSIVIAAKEKGIHIHALDLSTNGLREKNIEKARFIGNNLAIDRFDQTDVGQANGAIMMMDADTRISRQVSSQITQQLVNNPNIGMLKINYDIIPGEASQGQGERLYQTTPQERFSHNVDVFKKVLFGTVYHGRWNAIKANALGHKDPDNRIQTSTDLDTLTPLSGEMAFAHDIRIYQQDRARSGELGGGHGESRLEHLSEARKNFEDVDPALDCLILIHQRNKELTPVLREKIRSIMADCLQDDSAAFNELISLIAVDSNPNIRLKSEYHSVRNNHMVDANNYAQSSQKIIEGLLEKEMVDPAEFQLVVAQEVEREKMRHAVVSGTVNRVLERMFDPGRANVDLSEDNIHEYLSDSARQQTPRTHFIYNNPWIIDILNEVRQEAPDPESARELLNQRFPDLLLPFDETPYTKANATLLGVTRFIEEMRANPSEYPTVLATLHV